MEYTGPTAASSADETDVQEKAADGGAQEKPTATLGRKAALKAYLQAMGYPLQFVAILPDKGKIRVFRVTNDQELKALLPTLGSLNGHGWNIYAEANPGSKLDKNGKPARNNEASLTHIRCIVADVDAKNGVTMEQCEVAVDALLLRPSFIVQTGGGEQPYFTLNEPVEATDENRAKARAAGAGLAALLGGDPTFSLEHLFRVPGFINWPDEKKRARGRVPVMATIREAAGLTYSLDELKAFGKHAAQGDGSQGKPDPRLTSDDNSDLTGGMEDSKPFNDLSPDEKDACLTEMLAVPDVIAIAHGQARVPWRDILAACARSGAPDAEKLCRDWSMLAPDQYNEGHFNREFGWYAKTPPRPGDITIGSLIKKAKAGGWVPPWDKAPTSSGVIQSVPAAAVSAAQDCDSAQAVEDDDETESKPGDKDAEKALDLALTLLLADYQDAKSTVARIKRKWPQLADKAAELTAQAQRVAAKWKPGVVRNIGGLRKRIASIPQMNQQFVLIALPGQPMCIGQISDAQLLTEGDFTKRVADAVIVTGAKDGKPTTTPASKVWLHDNRRRLATEIKFTAKKVGPSVFNLWTTFGVTPKAGQCDLIYQHIHEVICAGRDLENEALLNLLTWQAQHIGTSSRTIVVLYSEEQQVGKGMLLEKILLPMYGRLHGFFTADAEKALGKFNDAIAGKVYMAFDEACFAGDRRVADKIKSVAATETTAIEKKGLPVVSLPTAVNIFMATNNAHAAHVEWTDARYWVLKVSPHRKGDAAYWDALGAEIDNGGVEAFLHDLLSRDVSGFRPQRDIPRDNEEHRANKLASDPAHPAIWLLECLENNQWIGSEKWEGRYTVDGAIKDFKGAPLMFDLLGACTARLLPAFLYDAYKEWAQKRGRYMQPASTSVFWKRLTTLGVCAARNKGDRWRIIPSRDMLRGRVEQMLGGAADWTA
jgi:hypothetical protein